MDMTWSDLHFRTLTLTIVLKWFKGKKYWLWGEELGYCSIIQQDIVEAETKKGDNKVEINVNIILDLFKSIRKS